MKITPILLAAAVLVVCALSAGCTSPTQVEISPAETTVVTTQPPSTSTASVTVVSTPLAIETLPAEQSVDIVVYKQRPDATIHLVYNGGMGEIFVQNVMMRVTGSDGQVNERYLNDGTRKPRRGDELVMDGTRGSDRVAVFLTSAGKTYKIYDEPLANPYY
jgi:outer membrane cobalamin receptor